MMGMGYIKLICSSRPPEYEQEIEAESEEKRTHVYLYAQPKGNFYSRRRYNFVIENGTWKINSAFDWRKSSGKWEKIRSI
jgi:hypothetical protein